MSQRWQFHSGDFWGGLAACLVAFPSAIAFGLVIYGPLGPQAAAQGALAGIIGAVILGIISPLFAGAPRLITAPCAPAAAVLSTLVIEIVHSAPQAQFTEVLLILSLIGLLTGLLQTTVGTLGGGKLIKFIPYPVVAGYLSGVGLIVLTGQIGKILGVSSTLSPWQAILHVQDWNWLAITIGMISLIAMWVTPKLTKKIPAPIAALMAGVATYFLLSLIHPELLVLQQNPLVVGELHTSEMTTPVQSLFAGANPLGILEGHWWKFVFFPALMLATLLSIDTLKTCVILDALTKSRHDSNRELMGQGAGNIANACLGGVPGAGTMGATLINLTGGAQTQWSGVYNGLFTLLILLFIGNFVAWVPLAALGGILTFVGIRMIDPHILELAKRKSTILDFAVVASVVVTALIFNLMAAAGVGIAFAILLFIREQIRGNVVRMHALGSQLFSKKRRLPEEIRRLEERGHETAIFELQGPLFFGTTDQLLLQLEPHLAVRRFIVLDLRRVSNLDFTGAHLLDQIETRLTNPQGKIIFTRLQPEMRDYLHQLGLKDGRRKIQYFDDFDSALEEIEDQLIQGGQKPTSDLEVLNLDQIQLFQQASPEMLVLFEKQMRLVQFQAHATIFHQGDSGDELFFVRKGDIRIQLRLSNEKFKHLTTFGRGDFFGDMAFLDHYKRSAEAIAVSECELYVLSRAAFDRIASDHPEVAGQFFMRMSQTLAARLRIADIEIRTLEDF